MTLADAPTRITPDDLLRMSDNNSLELIDGRIVEKHVSALSSEIEASISSCIGYFLRTNPVARVYASSLGYRCFSDHDMIRKPDFTVIRIERLARLSNPNPGYMPIVPDLAVEVISTNDTVSEINEKLHVYQDARFPLIWIVDPESKMITVHELGAKPYIRVADDEISAENALPGFSCKVADLFPPPLPVAAK
jgi:Uma2 family endonuclease